jgi:N-glycosylase/DNA lyase
MPSISLEPGQLFSLDQSLSCGQVFRWDRADNGWWYGVVEGKAMKVRQERTKLSFEGADRDFIRNYFSLDVELEQIIGSFDRDPFIHAAVTKCRGLRLIRQPTWECLISYTIATNSNIPTIRRRIAAIAEKFGREIRFDGRTFFSFAEPGDISCEDESELSCCKLGYRQPFVFRNACDIPDRTAWEQTVRNLPYEEARMELMKRTGIGPKAADCIILFAFGKYEAFPVDVWIRRIMQEHYPVPRDSGKALTKKEYDAIRGFGREYFGEYCGYAQEYLFAARQG